jgi:integrase
MGVFRRPDSPWWWLWLETAPRGQQKEKTKIKIGTTAAERKDSRRLAEDLYHQRMRELAAHIHRLPPPRPQIKFSAYALLYARDVISHHRGAVREAELLKALVAGLGDEPLHLIDRDRVRQWMAARRAQVSARTVNREIDLLKAMLRNAVPKYLDASPLMGMKKLAVVPPARRLLTPDEETKLLAVLAPDDKAIFLMGLDTLVRLGDILDLRREDDRGATLYIRDPKDPQQGSPYEVPVSKRLRLALDAVQATSSPYFFPRRRRAESEAGRRMVVRSALERACAKANLDYGRKKGGITFHWGTRRTGATRMIQRHVDIKTVQAVGHWKRPTVVLDIYAETTTAAMKAAVEAVSDSQPVPARGRR